MKRVLCIVSILVFLGSMTVFADPHVVPDGPTIKSIQFPNLPILNAVQPPSE